MNLSHRKKNKKTQQFLQVYLVLSFIFMMINIRVVLEHVWKKGWKQKGVFFQLGACLFLHLLLLSCEHWCWLASQSLAIIPLKWPPNQTARKVTSAVCDNNWWQLKMMMLVQLSIAALDTKQFCLKHHLVMSRKNTMLYTGVHWYMLPINHP